MADPKNTAAKAPTAAPKAPEAPKAPTAPVAPATENKPKKERVKWTYIFPSADAAKAEAEKRDGGPRRPFTLTINGATYYVVAHNPEHAKSLAFDEQKGTCSEIGKAAKAPKELSVDAILAALNTLPEKDREAVKAAMASIGK